MIEKPLFVQHAAHAILEADLSGVIEPAQQQQRTQRVCPRFHLPVHPRPPEEAEKMGRWPPQIPHLQQTRNGLR